MAAYWSHTDGVGALGAPPLLDVLDESHSEIYGSGGGQETLG